MTTPSFGTPGALDAWIKGLEKSGATAEEIIQTLDALQIPAGDPIHLRLQQQRALRLSKFTALPVEVRHERALRILYDQAGLATTDDRETLGIAGGICKRMWQDDGRRLHLERALVFYRRGHHSPIPGNDFYTSINAAYLELLIADQELTAGFQPAQVLPRRRAAAAIYRAVLAGARTGTFVPADWWQYATVAEACLGLGMISRAARWITGGIQRFNPSGYDQRTTLRQLAHIVELRRARRSDSWQHSAEVSLAAAFTIDVDAVRAALLGKVGLALSGGGFRASLFHIGVLARLAELDLLRHVEVLSCVSGGSIIGAQYYLELQDVMQRNATLTRLDYLKIVQRLETVFLAGVQTNIRTSAAADLHLNLRMLFESDYSRTERVAELYDERLFTRTPAKAPCDLNGLHIVPPGLATFNPKEQNWSRGAKVPVLILNATSLKTGHQWQFTAAGMGEPPYTAEQLDAVEILPLRPYAPGETMSLSRAVAASSGVPGLFSPLVVHRDGRPVPLIDGGVHDNQGVASLLDQECKTIIVSDASGQLPVRESGTFGTVASPLRANDILQARLRDAQLKDLLTRRRAGLLQGFVFVHMTHGLQNAASAPATPTAYGVRQDIQKLLAELRTDLDTFTDAEAYALMMSGYLMIGHAVATDGSASPALAGIASAAAPQRWNFLSVSGAIDGSNPQASKALIAALSKRASAAWPKRAALVLLAPLLIVFLLPLLFALLFAVAVTRYRNPDEPKPVDETIIGVLLATAGWLAANVYLAWYEPARKRRGQWP
jgi:predicted acylesterase/phospholipase RssA